jgi:hypothetical protein
MKTETPLVEYLIIGTHTSLWLLLLIGKLFGFSLQNLATIDPAIAVVFLPIIYLIGMLFDDITFQPLDYFRKKIRDKIYDSEKYKDEVLAYSSSELYSAYESRVRRVRVIGASIFNWPLLGFALLLQVGFSNQYQTASIGIISILLAVFSGMTWKSLYIRAYNFRKKACDVIFEYESLQTKAPIAKAKK